MCQKIAKKWHRLTLNVNSSGYEQICNLKVGYVVPQSVYKLRYLYIWGQIVPPSGVILSAANTIVFRLWPAIKIEPNIRLKMTGPILNCMTLSFKMAYLVAI